MFTCLAKNDPNDLERRALLAQAREEYRFDHRFLAPIPMMLERGTANPTSFGTNFGWLGALPRQQWPSPRYLLGRMQFQLRWKMNVWATENLWKLPEFTNLHEYDQMFADVTHPWCRRNWLNDAGFGFQRVGGPNPVVIRRVDGKLTEKFAVKGTSLERGLPDGTPLQEAIDDRRLYICDYAMLQGVPGGAIPNLKKHVPAPIGLFYVTHHGDLMPAAIQLTQEPHPGMVFTPRDSRMSWVTARIFFNIADMNHHEMSTHLCRVHFVEEGIVVATHRSLSDRHPIMTLLRPHFRFLLWNNYEGREVLLGQNGYASKILAGGAEGSLELIRRSWAGYPQNDVEPWHFEMLDLPMELASRGVDDLEKFPHYPYRHDGMLIWNALLRYVERYVRLYYTADGEVLADPELQAWARELSGEDGARVKRMPSAIESVEQLVRIVTRLLWTAGPQHAAVNYSQYNFMAYVPNMPGAAYAEPRAGLKDLTEEQLEKYIIDVLPRSQQAQVQLYTMILLTSYHYDRLGQYAAADFTDPRVAPVVKEFQSDLARIEQDLLMLNAVRRGEGRSYRMLLPSAVPNSTSI